MTRNGYRFPMNLCILLVVSLLCVGTARALKAEEKPGNNGDLSNLLKQGSEIYYSIKAGGDLIGCSIYKVERTIQLAGQSFIKLQSLSRIKAGMGSVEGLSFVADFSVAKQTLAPAYILMKQSSPGGEIVSEVIFSSGVIAQKNLVGKEQSSAIFPVDRDHYMLLNNVWGRLDTFIEHYLMLVLTARAGTTRIPVFDPILKATGTVEVVPGKDEQLDIGGTRYQCKTYILKDYYGIPLMSIWFEPKTARIIRMKEIGGNLVFELSSHKVMVEVTKAKGIDFLNLKTAPSPIYFPDAQKVEKMSVDARFTGRGFLNPAHKVLGFDQAFTGESSDTEASGKFEIKTSKSPVDKPDPFPPRKVPDELKSFLERQPGIEADNEFIKNKAMEITWKSKDVFVAASRLNKWIKDNIKQGLSLPSASFSFLNGIGNSESRSMLLVAMCRSLGIPARKVGGMAFKAGDFVPAHWVEINMGPPGWVPFDTESGSEGTIDAARVYLWEFGDISSVEFTALDYSPRPPSTVPYYTKDVTWPVGEERTYSIKKGDKVIGEEKAMVEDIVLSEGKETYAFRSESTLNIGENTFKATGNLVITPHVLPVEFKFESEMSGKKDTQHFKFGRDFISQILEVKDGEKIRDIPYSRGTYLIDQRFLSQWALVIGQIPKPQLGKKYNFTVFIPEDLRTREIELEVKNFERIEVGSGEMNAFRCESKKGMIFYVDTNSNVVKISLPPQELEIDLVKTEFKLKK
jgi:hypothetical protein